ncbi:MAG: serine hydrolase, partial [Chitinophagales bacterium]|nr:serine hydrolase [Chitinophagales bacterium]
ITKTLTGACVLQLVDEGILHLDDSVFTWQTQSHLLILL